MALITFGEGWHNNHHAHPTSARHGLAWYEFDLSWIQIKVLKFFGIAKSIQVARVNSRADRARSRVSPDRAARPHSLDCLRADGRMSLQRYALSWKYGGRRPAEVDRILHRARRRPDFRHPPALRRLGAAQLAHTAFCSFSASCCWLMIIGGVVLNTIFLVREIRRNEQHDAFINAVTHELKTPVASIRLYLETLQTRAVDEDKRKEFYRIMLEDSDRLLAHHRTGAAHRAHRAPPAASCNLLRIDLGGVVEECLARARTLHQRLAGALRIPSRAAASRFWAIRTKCAPRFRT